MKQTMLIVTLLAITVSVFSQNKDVEAVKQLNISFIHCSVTRDSATLSQIFADDMILTAPDGATRTKQEMLQTLVTNPAAVTAKVDTATVRLFSNIAIINAVASFVIIVDGKPTPGKTNYMDVYEKRKGKWLAVAAHVTYFPQP